MAGLLKNLRSDIPASVVVFFVALPLCLGIAMASGAPLFSGLVAGIVGGVVVGAISKAPLGVSGPAAGLAVIVFTSIESLGSFEAFLVAVVLAGVIQMGLGIAKAGICSYFFPSSVIHGMLAGIGILIITKQMPYALGTNANASSSAIVVPSTTDSLPSAAEMLLGTVHPGVTLITLLALALLIGWERKAIKRNKVLGVLPGPVVAVLSAVGLHLIFQKAPAIALLPLHLVAIPEFGSASEFLALFKTPDPGLFWSPAVWGVACTLAVVASIETLLCVEAIDKLDPLKRTTPANRELIAQGVGNTVSGLLGGLPITQVIVRSSANLQAGARSKVSTMMHGILLLICVFGIPHLLNLVPLGALAAVLIMTGFKLAKPELFAGMWRYGPHQFAPFITTVVGVVATDLLTGVALGMLVSIAILLHCNYRNSHVLHRERALGPRKRPEVTIRLSEEVTFLNKPAIKAELSSMPDGSVVVIDMTNCVYVNHDVAETISDFIQSAETRDISVRVIGASRHPDGGVRNLPKAA